MSSRTRNVRQKALMISIAAVLTVGVVLGLSKLINISITAPLVDHYSANTVSATM